MTPLSSCSWSEVSANEPITRGGILLIRHAHHPCRGGWFNKAQTLAYLVMAYGQGHSATQECAALYYAGPEKLEPTYEGMDDALEADADEGEGEVRRRMRVSYPSCSSTVPGIS